MRSAGRGFGGRDPAQGSRSTGLGVQRGSLLGRGLGGWGRSGGDFVRPYPRQPGSLARSSVLSRMHEQGLWGGPLGLGPLPMRRLSQAGYEEWVQPEIAVKAGAPPTLALTGLAGEPAPAETKLPLEELVKNYINGRRQAYLGRGRRLFKERRYREAHNAFTLADAVSLDDSKARSLVKLMMVYSGVASQQYSQAIVALKWLLNWLATPDPQTGQLPDPDSLNQIDVRSLYGVEQGQALGGMEEVHPYDVHVRNVEGLVIQNPTIVESKALHAFVLWQDKGNIGTRGNALFHAQRIASSPGAREPWTNLHQVMQNADAASRRFKTAPGVESSLSESVSALLPFKLPEAASSPKP